MPRRSAIPSDDSDSDGLDDLEIITTTTTTSTSSHATLQGQKRTHDTMNAGGNNTTVVNANIIAGVKNFAKCMKLSDEQITDVETFLNDTAIGCQGREYVAILHVGNEIKKIVKTQGQWEPSASLKKNIKHYVEATSLSTHLRSFLSTQTVQAVVNKLLDLGLDLPENIRENQALHEVLSKTVSEAFTQRRSTMKKAIKASLGDTPKGKNAKYTPHEKDIDCDNIYELTRALAKNTKCKVDAALCARAAILRRAFKKAPGENFWERVDKMLEDIRVRGDNDPQKIAALVKDCLDKDRQKYGINDYQIQDEEQSDAQMQMDQILGTQALSLRENQADPKQQESQAGPNQGSTPSASAVGSDFEGADQEGDDGSGSGS